MPNITMVMWFIDLYTSRVVIIKVDYGKKYEFIKKRKKKET